MADRNSTIQQLGEFERERNVLERRANACRAQLDLLNGMEGLTAHPEIAESVETVISLLQRYIDGEELRIGEIATQYSRMGAILSLGIEALTASKEHWDKIH